MDKERLLKLLLLSSTPLALAFLGDSIHTQFVREQVLSSEKALSLNSYNKKSSFYCKASSQSYALQNLSPLLKEDELDIVRRARNCKPKHQAKNATSADYSFATAFEALLGYLYLKDEKRLKEILNKSFEIMQKMGEKHEN